MNANVVGSLDPRVQRTQRRLRRAFVDLVTEKGYQRLTVQEITGRADVNRTTFYRHFADKEALMMHVVDHLVKDLMAEISPPPEGTTVRDPAIPTRQLAGLFERARDQYDFLAAMTDEQGAPMFLSTLIEAMERVLCERIRRAGVDEARAPVPVPIVVASITGAEVAVLKWWLAHTASCSAESVAEKLVEVMTAGVYGALGIDEQANHGSSDRGGRPAAVDT